VPLARLSTAPMTITRPAVSSSATWRWTALEPRTAAVCGQRGSVQVADLIVPFSRRGPRGRRPVGEFLADTVPLPARGGARRAVSCLWWREGADRDASRLARSLELAVVCSCGGSCGGLGNGVVLAEHSGHWLQCGLAKRQCHFSHRGLDPEVAVQPRQWASPLGADSLPDLNDLSRGRQLGAEQHLEQDGRSRAAGAGGVGAVP